MEDIELTLQRILKLESTFLRHVVLGTVHLPSITAFENFAEKVSEEYILLMQG